jgi:Leucine-rich repeat (LRR) protein
MKKINYYLLLIRRKLMLPIVLIEEIKKCSPLMDSIILPDQWERLTDSDMGVIVDAITSSKNTYIKRLIFAENDITDAGVERLCELKHIQVLNLAHNELITDVGAGYIASSMTTLTSLSLSGNNITDAGLAKLLQHPSLTSLRLDGTKITDASVEAILRNTTLQSITLSDTQVSPENVKRIYAHVDQNKARAEQNSTRAEQVQFFPKAMPPTAEESVSQSLLQKIRAEEITAGLIEELVAMKLAATPDTQAKESFVRAVKNIQALISPEITKRQ